MPPPEPRRWLSRPPVGLREVKIDGSKFFLNGKPVWIKGVNRHDTSPLNGRAVTTDEILSDVW